MRTTTPLAEPSRSNTLAFYGGAWVGLVPIVVLVGGISWLSFARQGGTKAFWAFAWLALVAGLLVAKDKGRYCRSAMRGLADEGGIAIIVAWMFASILGALMNAGGLVEGITWLGTLSGVDRSAFTLATYVSAMLFAVGTGTSNGTAIALVPVLYPAGVALGADPAFLALAILSGGVFGDNLAPVSDSTIVSAFTQGATIRDVVRSRFPLAMAAATIAGIVLFAFGGSEAEIMAQATEATDGTSALLLLSLVVVIVAALRGRHLIEALTYGIVTAVAIGMAIGHLELSQLVHIPPARGESTGLIQDGISGVSGAIIFVLLLLGITQVVSDSGLMERLLVFLQRAVIKTVRQSEMAIIWITILISIPVSANAPAELLVGPTLVRPLGERFKLTPARRANLMDCAVCSVFYMLPWHLAVMVWHHQIELAATQHDLPLPEIGIAFYNPYSWAILAVILFSAYTGWNRRLESEDAA